MAVLEILAAANASISIIKTSIGHGKDMASMAKHFGNLLGAEEQLQQAVNKKKSSFKARLMGGTEDDFEEFAQLERLRARKKELESYMKLMCAPGTYDRYVKHMADARRARREAEKEAKAAKQEMIEAMWLVIVILLAGACLGGFIWYRMTLL